MGVRSWLAWGGLVNPSRNVIDDFVVLVDTTTSMIPLPLGVGWTVARIVSPLAFDLLYSHPIVATALGVWWIIHR